MASKTKVHPTTLHMFATNLSEKFLEAEGGTLIVVVMLYRAKCFVSKLSTATLGQLKNCLWHFKPL